MKRFYTQLTAILLAGIFLAACGSPMSSQPAAAPAPTALTEPGQDATVQAEPTPAPVEISFTGTPVSFDRLSLVIPNGVAAGGSGEIVPEAQGDETAPWEVAPQHIRFTLEGYALEGKLYQPQIFVYPAQAYADMQTRGDAAQSLERLRRILDQSAMINIKELPMAPFIPVPQALAAQVQVVPFQHGKGVRMVTQYAMGRAIINNHELLYHFEGLTEDGQSYIIVILPVAAPILPENGEPGGSIPDGGVPVPDFNDINANWLGYYGEARQMLQSLEADAYYPDLDQLDALIASLMIASSSK
jgi:hypothetical protein